MMRARIERDQLRQALRTVLPAVGARPHPPVLGGVHIDAGEAALTFSCTDLDLTIRTAAAADVGVPGTVVAPARLLAAFVDRAPAGAVALEADGTELHVTACDAHATVPALPIDEWPRIQPADGDPVTLDAQQVDRLRRILPFASTDRARPILTGVLLWGDRAAATDSYRLAEATFDGVDMPRALVPARALAAALRGAGGDVDVTVGGNHVTLAHGGASWTSVLLGGEYLAYERLIRDDSPRHLTFDATELADALRLATVVDAPVARDEPRSPARIHRGGDKARVWQRTADIGEVVDVVGCTGDFDDEVGFNPDYLVELLAAAGTEQVTIGLVDALKPAQVHVDGLVLVLMPVRLS